MMKINFKFYYETYCIIIVQKKKCLLNFLTKTEIIQNYYVVQSSEC